MLSELRTRSAGGTPPESWIRPILGGSLLAFELRGETIPAVERSTWVEFFGTMKVHSSAQVLDEFFERVAKSW